MTEEELWCEDDNAPHGMFMLMKSAVIRGDDSEMNLARCDINDIGPVGMNWEPGDGTFVGKTRFPFPVRPVDEQLKEFARLVSYHSHFFIMYVSRGIKNENGEWTITPESHYYPGTHSFISETGAHTIGGFFRLLWEWTQVYEEPFNERYFPAIYAKKVFETLPFTPEILDEIKAMPPQAMFRFLSGEQDVNVNERLSGPYTLSDNFKQWFKDVMYKYRGSNTEYLAEL